MKVIVSWAVEINLVCLREDRSDCDEFLSTLLSLVGILWLSFYKD